MPPLPPHPPCVCPQNYSSNMLLTSVFSSFQFHQYSESGKTETSSSGSTQTRLNVECTVHSFLFLSESRSPSIKEFAPSCSALCYVERDKRVHQMPGIFLPLALESLLSFTMSQVLQLLNWSVEFSQSVLVSIQLICY